MIPPLLLVWEELGTETWGPAPSWARAGRQTETGLLACLLGLERKIYIIFWTYASLLFVLSSPFLVICVELGVEVLPAALAGCLTVFVRRV